MVFIRVDQTNAVREILAQTLKSLMQFRGPVPFCPLLHQRQDRSDIMRIVHDTHVMEVKGP